LRVRVPIVLPPWILQRFHQAARPSHRRCRRRLLPVERGRVPWQPRRGGLRAAGQPAGPRVARPDQHLRQRQHLPRARGAVPPPLRPHPPAARLR
ncbi:hypothetical protein ACJX0J_007369, partial [Zea mays]